MHWQRLHTEPSERTVPVFWHRPSQRLLAGTLELGLAMLTTLTTPGLTLLFLGVVVCLGTAFVWMIWEMEQSAKSRLAKARRDSDSY